MLTQLPTVKERLNLEEYAVQYDALIARVIEAVSQRFERECNRLFGRAVDAFQQFNAQQLEVRIARYPIETVTRFEVKENETGGWVERETKWLVREACVISVAEPLGTWREQARVTYTGGFVLPGIAAEPGQAVLPADLEHAAVEQVAWWFQNRDKLGLLRIWPHQGTYQQFAQLELLPDVAAVLRTYTRW